RPHLALRAILELAIVVDPVAPAEPAEAAIYGEPGHDPVDPVGAWLGVVVGDRHHVLLRSVEAGVERRHLAGLVHQHLVARAPVTRSTQRPSGKRVRAISAPRSPISARAAGSRSSSSAVSTHGPGSPGSSVSPPPSRRISGGPPRLVASTGTFIAIDSTTMRP